GKYRSGKYKEIGIVVHNGHAFSRNQHFSRDRMVEYCKSDTWKAINNALKEDGHTFRIWKKHTEIIESCKQLVDNTIDWQYQEGIINEEKKSILSESLKVVDLACVKHEHDGCWNVPNYHINDVVCIDIKSCYPAIAVNGKLPQDDITGFAQISSFKFASNIHPAPIVFLQYLLETGILESVTVGEAIISLIKQTKVWLPENQDISCAIIGKLDFLIKDCTNAGTFADKERCPLGFILIYYEGHQPQYMHLIATNFIYIQKKALYKIKNVPAFFKQVEVKSNPNLCSYYPSCAMCTDSEEFFISKLEYAKWIKEFQKTKIPLVKYDCKRHKPFICRFCFAEWFYRPDSYALLHQPEEQEILEIQPGQWHDKDSIAPSIHDPITKYRNSYLNGEGEWTSKRMGEKKFPNVIIWNEVICCGDNAQPLPFFGEMPHNWLKECANYYEEVLTDYRAKCPKLRELKKEKWKRLEKEWTLSDHILSAHHLSQRIVSQNCLELYCIKYSDLSVPLIYRPRDECNKTALFQFLNLGYAMTVHTSQEMTLEAPQWVWVIDEHLIWNNLIYLAIEEAKNKKAIEQSLRLFISEKLFIDMVKQDNDSVMNFYMKVKASTSNSEKQVRKIFINRLSPENYLKAEKFESGILLNELVERLWVLESEHKAKLKAEVINIIENAFENGAKDLKKTKN
ncbi:20491_t:CDS:10, partial [Cetraspora pellucida]